MNSLMQQALGSDWDRLPAGLKAHHQFGPTIERGRLHIDFPCFMLPVLSVLGWLGALVNRRGHDVPTVVEKSVQGERQHWRRMLRYPDAKPLRFNSVWTVAAPGQLTEYVNAILGLRMAVHVEGERLRYSGIHYLLKLGAWQIPIPEWLVLGHTTIVEEAIDDSRFAMDFRLVHPLFGEVFRYAGEFQVAPISACESD